LSPRPDFTGQIGQAMEPALPMPYDPAEHAMSCNDAGGAARASSGGSRGRPRRGRRLPRRRLLLGWSLVLAAVLAAGVTVTAYGAYLGTVGRVRHITITGLGDRPRAYNQAENILVIGAYNGTKDYVSHRFHPSDDQGADTYVLVHVAPGHKGAVMISFPRDSMVPVFGCPASGHFGGQQAQPGTLEALNLAYARGGPGCSWKTIEQSTGIRIGHFIEVDYLGFEKFVGALGGVEVCLPYPVDIPNDGLRLQAGRHLINRAQALEFVRARDIGQWSDLQRIKRQQFFMISVMQAALHQGLLGNPLRLLSVAHAVAPYLTTDSGFGLSALYSLARSMQGTELGKVQLIEVPIVPYPANPMVQVSWQQPAAERLFTAVARDRSVPRAPRRRPAASRPVPRVAPARVRVDVLNGNGVPGVAGRTSTYLAGRGFTVTGTGNAGSFSYPGTLIQYTGPSDRPAASTLGRAVAGARLRQVAGLGPGTVRLIIGAGFRGGRTSPPTSPKALPVGGLAKSYGGVTGGASICQDQSAFSG
jgi:LCP family protein required for cell wall assembly